jgi:anti-sigma factor ChrR (cupin superfamily)
VTDIGDIRELLPLYALGVLDAHEQAIVEHAAAVDPALAAELASYFDTAAAMIGEPNPVDPPDEIRSQIIASSGGGKYATHAARMATLFDVPLERAHELLGLMERKHQWKPQMHGITVVDFEGGPAVATADCGFIKIKAGCTFPHHKHRGDEMTVVLMGTIRDLMTGLLHGPGEEVSHEKDTEHEIACEGDEDAVLAFRTFDGIDIDGKRRRAND